MKITENNLKKWDACEEGIAWFMKNKPFKSDIDCIEKLMQDKKGTIVDGVSKNLDWSVWGLDSLLTMDQRSQIVKFAHGFLIGSISGPASTGTVPNKYLYIEIIRYGLKLLKAQNGNN